MKETQKETQLLQEIRDALTQQSKPSEGVKPWSPEKGTAMSPLSQPPLPENFRPPQDHGSTPAVEGDMKKPPDKPAGETPAHLLRKDTCFQAENTPSSSTKGVRAHCQMWLKARLSEGPVPLAIIAEEARQLGYSRKAIRLARLKLKVQPMPCIALPTIDGETQGNDWEPAENDT